MAVPVVAEPSAPVLGPMAPPVDATDSMPVTVNPPEPALTRMMPAFDPPT